MQGLRQVFIFCQLVRKNRTDLALTFEKRPNLGKNLTLSSRS